MRIREADRYLASRTGCYEWRCERYNAVVDVMKAHGRLGVIPTLIDVGAGMCELARCLYGDHRWQGRYIPIDAAIDGTDLGTWKPPRDADWFVALEVLEHLWNPARLLHEMKARATRGVIVSTPNPETTDVLAMDPTHLRPITAPLLEMAGFKVERRSFYGEGDDSLFGVWLAS